MNTRKILSGIFAFFILLVASCTTDTESSDVYEIGIDKKDVQTGPNKRAIDKKDVQTSNKRAIDKKDVQVKN